MGKEIITINKVEAVTFRSGKTGTKFNDRFNIFDEALANELKDNIGKAFEFDVQTDATGKYENIRQMGTPIGNMPAQSVKTQTEAPKPITMNFDQEVKQNSRVFGAGADQIKVYFNTADDLVEQLKKLKDWGLLPASYYKSMDEAFKAKNPKIIKEAEEEKKIQEKL